MKCHIKLHIVKSLLFHLHTGVDNILLEQPVAVQNDIQVRLLRCISCQQLYSIVVTDFALPFFGMSS